MTVVSHRPTAVARGDLAPARFAAWAVALGSLLMPPAAGAADTYQTGTINNITSTPSGLMLMLDNGPPTNCNGTPYGWMLIPEANKTMIATALMLWATGQRGVAVYTNAYTGNGFCTITQFDPN